METKRLGDFLTNYSWFQSVITEDVIICGVSALEYLGMFTGFLDETLIDVFATQKGNYDNINYIIVDTFDDVDYFVDGNIKCATFEYTINEMLNDLKNADYMALAEALSNYYTLHNDSFEGLKIKPENIDNFNSVKEDAIHYYDCG